MRPLALISLALLPLAACGTMAGNASPFEQPNSLMKREIDNRIAQIPYQHREELFNNMLWLAQTGEQTIEALMKGLQNEVPKVRSSCAWVLGRIGDRRVIPALQEMTQDQNPIVRLEVARTLVLMGDMTQVPALIAGLDSDRIQVRYNCHEALKAATGRDFGYDHLAEDMSMRHQAVLAWRTWWSKQSGDPWFAEQYAKKFDLNPDGPAEVGTPAVPGVEVEPPEEGGAEGGKETEGQILPDKGAGPSGKGQEGR